MRSVKLFLTVVILLIVFLAVITVFLPSKITVSKSVVINAPEPEVANQVASFKNWKNWYPAFQNRDITVTEFRQNDRSVVILSDRKQRKLSMTLTRQGPEDFNVLLFVDNRSKISYQFILLAKNATQTQLTWNINTTLKWYPWEKITGIFLDKVTGPQYRSALQNLKRAAELHHGDSAR
jgi:hypothetical protein